MKTATLILLSSVALVGAAGIAAARGPAGGMSFETLDVDGSGEITAEDLDAMRAGRFAEIDADGDGSVTEAEFLAHVQARAAERAAGMFARFDADGDGVVGRDAFEARFGQGGPGPRMLERFDTDSSGGISAEEFETAHETMSEHRGMRRGGHGDGGHGEGGWWGLRHK